jgi:hypothetical protein
VQVAVTWASPRSKTGRSWSDHHQWFLGLLSYTAYLSCIDQSLLSVLYWKIYHVWNVVEVYCAGPGHRFICIQGSCHLLSLVGFFVCITCCKGVLFLVYDACNCFSCLR